MKDSESNSIHATDSRHYFTSLHFQGCKNDGPVLRVTEDTDIMHVKLVVDSDGNDGIAVKKRSVTFEHLAHSTSGATTMGD